MDSYRAEKRATQKLQLDDEDAEIGPIPTDGNGGYTPESEMDRLSNILKTFNDLFGNIEWQDTDRIEAIVTKEIPAKVKADVAYRNAQMYSERERTH